MLATLAERRAEYRRRYKHLYGDSKSYGRTCAGMRNDIFRRASDADVTARFAEMPKEDTRDLTGRTFDDPLPGRSALDKRLGVK